ncbi:hypothetical protein [Sphingomonas sp.]|jgi:hypothetical protein|uniref:hypothetical protein n=1 Tax=Sphingomonas sp. TaxID=28214 RepID=UPI0035C7CE7E
MIRTLTRLGLRRPPPPLCPIGLDQLERNWQYRPSRPDAVDRLRRLRALGRWQPAPAHECLVPIRGARDRWIVYFLFLPAGRSLDSAHRYTLARLRASGTGLLVVCAAARAADVPAELHGIADALYWKALGGFDFSAYALGLHAIAAANPGADVLVLNDSVFGPFGPIDALWPLMTWDLTGFTACGQVENHIQSYAFHLKNVTPQRMAGLAQVLPAGRAHDQYEPVVLRQETRLAVDAARRMSVGALWYGAPDLTVDPSLFAAMPLVEAGFPFLKRALRTKHTGIYPDEAIRAVLVRRGHPPGDGPPP